MHVHCSGLQGDRALSCSPRSLSSQYNSLSGKMVLKRPFVSDTGKSQFCTFIVQVSQETALSSYDNLSGKMVIKRLCIGDTGEVSCKHIHCSGLWETEL